MSAATLRRRTPAAASAVGEVKRLRDQLARVSAQLADVTAQRDRLAGMLADLTATIDHEAEISYRRQLAAEAAARAAEAGEARGYERCAGDYARAWRELAAEITGGGPRHADLELLRWGPGGREHFGDPRPGDFPGFKRGGEAW